MTKKQMIGGFALVLLLGALRLGALWYRYSDRNDEHERRHATRECERVIRHDAPHHTIDEPPPPLDPAEVARCLPVAVGCAREAEARPPIVVDGMTLSMPSFEYDGEALCVQARLKNPSAPFPQVVVP
jgi:hypothetical protein